MKKQKYYFVYSKNLHDDSVVVWGHANSRKAAYELAMSFDYDCSLYILSATWFKMKHYKEYSKYMTNVIV